MVEQRSDQYNLQRFLDMQARAFDWVVTELRQGHKRSHWMWFIFPQIAGLGLSAMARRFAISGRKEAEAYLEHKVLGKRLRECTELVNQVSGRDIEEIFGSPDDLKFRSSVTLFGSIDPGVREFRKALDKYFSGEPDLATLALL